MKENLTLVIVDTTTTKDISQRTIEYCQKIFPCKEALLFTDQPVKTSVTNISNIDITSLKGYSAFLLTGLVDYINTSHYIFMQNDGYIMNPNAWTDSYLDYDYIGAPWPHHPMHYWPPHAPVGPNTSVGNGGFSLRSLKLAKTVKRIFIHRSKYSQDFTIDKWKLEDCFICRDIRPLLEKNNCRFASEEIANTFSCENTKYNNQFGFHGKETMRLNNFNYL